MNGSLKWLNDYVDVSLPAEELGERLTRIGIPVENVTMPDERMLKLITVEVRTVAKHPEADKLQVATIWDGIAEHQLITGAKNIQAGQKLYWAPPGTELPNGQKIEKAMFRGLESEGMLCSADEVLLDSKLEGEESKDGLLIAHPTVEVGSSYASAMGFDTPVLEFELTANRADCFSMIGLAREISVLTGEAIKLPAFELLETASVNAQEVVRIQVENGDLCPRFTAKVLTDVKIGPSPAWLVERLQSVGLRSINNVVDVTNFVMMETCQPLHAYDLDKLSGNVLIARSAHAGEKLITLDEKERTLTPEMIVIADDKGAVGLAGVMGGLKSEVTPATQRIVLEGAVFHGPSVRRTSRALGLRSDASSRFERGVDQQATLSAVERAAQLLCDMGAAKIAKGAWDVESKPAASATIPFTVKKINQLLGADISEETVLQILKSVGCMIEKGQNDSWSAVVPSWRSDMTLIEDLTEEVVRIYGFEKIKSTLPVGACQIVELPKLSQIERLTTDTMIGMGFNQTVHFSFSCPEVVAKLRMSDDSVVGTMIPVLNPIVDELSHMKTTLLGCLLATLQRNQAQKPAELKLFEVARVFHPKKLPIEELPTEILRLTGVASGSRLKESWQGKSAPIDFFYMKGIAEGILRQLGISNALFATGNHPALHPGRTAQITVDGKEIGWVGEVHPEVQEGFDLTERAYVIDIALSDLVDEALPLSSYQAFGKFPSVYRDLAFVVDRNVNSSDLLSTLKTAAGPLLISGELFDVYQGEHVAADKKSVAYALKFQCLDRTLEETEIEALIQEIIAKMKSTHQAELRS